MAKVLVSEEKLINIANAIREKTGETGSLKLDEMVTSIGEISGGSDVILPDGTKFYNSTFTEFPNGLDTSNIVNMTNMFYGCRKLTSISKIDTSNATNTSSMFYNCSVLTSVPNLITNKVNTFDNMFYGCSKLVTIPVLNLEMASSVYNMFKNCSSLSEESLNNILAMAPTAKILNMTGGETLKNLGLTTTQATACQSLSNYQSFLDAGWTTGY